MNEVALSHDGHQIGVDCADRMTAGWPNRLDAQIASRFDRDQIEASITALRQPCHKPWLAARVLALLSPYFTADIPEGVRRIEAEDWMAALSQHPRWAIEKACRWWKGDENPDRRRKPLEGDIAHRVRREMGILSFAAMKVREYDRGPTLRHTKIEEVPPTPEEMEQRKDFVRRLLAEPAYAKMFGAHDREEVMAPRKRW
jgi:hypothetical protein